MINLNMDDKNSLDLAVLMSHEAFRDGVTGSATEQEIETAKAALAHMSIGATLAKTYGGSSLNEFNRKEAEEYQKALETGDWSKVNEAVEKYDSTADYWKLMKNGDFIDDKRSSLYVETEGDEEYRLWDLDNMSKEEALHLLTSQDNGNLYLSEKSKKRLGLYMITHAQLNLEEETYEQLAQNSYKIGDELGYFVDLSLVNDKLAEKAADNAYLSGAFSGIQDPTGSFLYNESSLSGLAYEYGTLYSAGLKFSVDDPINNTIGTNNQLVSEDGNLALFDQIQLANAHNNNFSGTGRFSFGQMYNHTMSNNSTGINAEQLSAIAGGTAMASQYIEGTLQGYNATGVRLPTWNVGGMKYFSAYKPEWVGISSDGISTTNVYTPQFYDSTYTQTQNSINKYSDYLDMPESWNKRWTKFKYDFTGW